MHGRDAVGLWVVSLVHAEQLDVLLWLTEDRPHPAMSSHPGSTSIPRGDGEGRNSASRLYPAVRGRRAVAAKLEVDLRMTEPSDTSDTPARPQDYAGLRAELTTLVNDFTPVITKLWPRLEDHKYRWELHSYGLPEGYDKLVVSDIIDLLIGALKGIGVADNKLLQAHTKADHHNPSNPDAA